MHARRLTALLTILLLLAAPAVALADSGGGGAGDQEYQDPLTAPATPHKKKPKNQATAPATSTAPATTTQSTSTVGASQVSAKLPAQKGSELPRTGAPAGLLALMGAGLLGAGVALRRRTAPQR